MHVENGHDSKWVCKANAATLDCRLVVIYQKMAIRFMDLDM
jgi:hypothetical protein